MPGLPHHRDAIDRLRWGDPDEIQKRRHHIGKAHEPVVDRAFGHARIALVGHHDHRDIRAALVKDPLRRHPVIAQHVPVISGEHDDRIVEDPLQPQRPDQVPDLVEVTEPGASRVAPFDLAGHVARGPIGGVVLFGKVPWPPVVLVVDMPWSNCRPR